jgi:Phosphotransferase enzyme family
VGPLTVLPWAEPAWRERAERWIAEQVGRLGRDPTGPVAEVKMRPWSAVLRAPTSAGDVYFKANLPALANEPALTRLLARIDPGHVLPVLAEEPGEGWMLQADGGPTMRSRLDGSDDVPRWERMLAGYAELQVRACEDVEELLAAGAPDRRLAALPGLFERLVEGEADDLRGLAPRVAELCAELEAFGLPASVDHGDLHAGNVLAPGDEYVFFDWHEGTVSHPFFSMVVVMQCLAHDHGIEPGAAAAARLRDAYLAPWAGSGGHGSLQGALDLALRVGPLTRALGWARALRGLPPPEWAEWAENVPGWLLELRARVECE